MECRFNLTKSELALLKQLRTKPKEFFQPGFTFQRREGKKGIQHYTLEDIHTTSNLAGDIVQTEYVCTKSVMGQNIRVKFPIVTLQRAEMEGRV